jgi:hypothetical protein
MAGRQQRLDDLERTARQYIQAERSRLGNEVQFLEAVLKGRTGGAGVQQIAVRVVTAVAQNDLAAYLKGPGT